MPTHRSDRGGPTSEDPGNARPSASVAGQGELKLLHSEFPWAQALVPASQSQASKPSCSRVGIVIESLHRRRLGAAHSVGERRGGERHAGEMIVDPFDPGTARAEQIRRRGR